MADRQQLFSHCTQIHSADGSHANDNINKDTSTNAQYRTISSSHDFQQSNNYPRSSYLEPTPSTMLPTMSHSPTSQMDAQPMCPAVPFSANHTAPANQHHGTAWPPRLTQSCFNCGMPGHVAQYCPQPYRSFAASDRPYQMGQPNHMAVEHSVDIATDQSGADLGTDEYEADAATHDDNPPSRCGNHNHTRYLLDIPASRWRAPFCSSESESSTTPRSPPPIMEHDCSTFQDRGKGKKRQRSSHGFTDALTRALALQEHHPDGQGDGLQRSNSQPADNDDHDQSFSYALVFDQLSIYEDYHSRNHYPRHSTQPSLLDAGSRSFSRDSSSEVYAIAEDRHGRGRHDQRDLREHREDRNARKRHKTEANSLENINRHKRQKQDRSSDRERSDDGNGGFGAFMPNDDDD